MKRMILAKGAVETLTYFSQLLSETFEKLGLEVCFWDLQTPLESRNRIENFIVKGETCFLTFNFIGLSGEGQFRYAKTTIWEYYDIPCFCIMVDHPLYYYKQLSARHHKLTLACIDRDHRAFVREYYPSYPVHFVPLAGNEIPAKDRVNPLIEEPEPLPLNQRPIDVLFCGNYVSLEGLKKHIQGVDEEYVSFYHEIIDYLVEHPQETMEAAMVTYLKRDIPAISKEDILSCLYHMVYIDLYVRSYYRGRLICAIAEAGIDITVIGKDWEQAGCQAMEHLHQLGQSDSLTCFQYMKKARVSLNLMPWFKNGAHDRIFSGMLAGSLVVSDDSAYLREILTNNKEYITFSLENIEIVPQQLRTILDELQRDAKPLRQIADCGYQQAKEKHTWANRARDILEVWGLS